MLLLLRGALLLLLLLAAAPAAVVRAKDPLPECEIFTDNQCTGTDVETPATYENRRWYTPERGAADWQESYQDFALLSAHVHMEYSSAARTEATVTIMATSRDGVQLTYGFDGVYQASATKTFSAKAGDKGPIAVSVKGADGSLIELEPIEFVWDAAEVVTVGDGDYREGQKGGIVEFFMWPHADVEKECDFLAKAGWMGAKLFPVHEQVMSQEPFSNDLNPWYFAYQPVSYRLQGRMGTRDDLRSLINTCRSAGVRMYADAVVNHFVGGGNDVNPNHRNPNAGCTYWGGKNSSLEGGPSPMYTQSFAYTYGDYTDEPPSQEFPAADMGPTDFHCERTLDSWTDPLDLNAGWLDGLVDVNTEKDSVQERIADYMVDLLNIGFSGFRIDAAKHIQPADLVGIFTKLRDNMGGSLPDDFITYLEVLLGGEADMLCGCSEVDEAGYDYDNYCYCGDMETAFYDAGWTEEDVNKIKIWNSGYPKEPQSGWSTISPVRGAIENDDADQQTDGSTSRDMGDDGCVLVEGCAVDDHRNFEIKLFQDPNGVDDNDNEAPIRLLLSSYYWQGDSEGVPDGKSDCTSCQGDECDSCRTTDYYPAYDADSCGYDGEYQSTGVQPWTRTHRDIDVINAMRDWMGLKEVTGADLGLSC